MSDFGCKWLAYDGSVCPRGARDSGYCQWHEIGHRLHSAMRCDFGFPWLNTAWSILIFVLFGKFVVHGMRHVLMLGSGKYVEDITGHHPLYAPLLLGLAAIFMAMIVLRLYDGRHHEDWITVRIRYAVPTAIACLAAGTGVLLSPFAEEGTRIEMWGWLLLSTGVLIVALRVELRTGIASSVLVLTGLALVFLAGCMTPVLELAHYLHSSFDYMPAIQAEIREAHVRFQIIMGIGLAAAAVDAFVALRYTGRLLTPVGWRQRLVAPPASFGDSGRFLFLTCAGLVVLYGQGMVLRYCLWAIFHGFVLDSLPMWDLIFALLAIGAHYWISHAQARAQIRKQLDSDET